MGATDFVSGLRVARVGEDRRRSLRATCAVVVAAPGCFVVGRGLGPKGLGSTRRAGGRFSARRRTRTSRPTHRACPASVLNAASLGSEASPSRSPARLTPARVPAQQSSGARAGSGHPPSLGAGLFVGALVRGGGPLRGGSETRAEADAVDRRGMPGAPEPKLPVPPDRPCGHDGCRRPVTRGYPLCQQRGAARECVDHGLDGKELAPRRIHPRLRALPPTIDQVTRLIEDSRSTTRSIVRAACRLPVVPGAWEAEVWCSRLAS